MSLSISIVTVSYNMEDYVRQTIKSVVEQDFGGLEYIFLDGKSTDKTFLIAEEYSSHISTLISEKDDGQYHALNKGLSISTGDVMGWINADDILLPWTLSVVAEIFEQFPEIDWITGIPSFMNGKGQLTKLQSKPASYPPNYIANGWYQKNIGAYLQQESMFWRRSLWDKAGPINTSYRLAADFELWTRFAKHARLVPVDIPLAAFRERPGLQRSSASSDIYEREIEDICRSLPPPPRVWKHASSWGLVARAIARLLIRAKGPLVVYDRVDAEWVFIERSRSISRLSMSSLIDEYKIRRRLR